MGGHGLAQRGLRPAAVLGPDRPPERVQAQAVAAAPVAADARRARGTAVVRPSGATPTQLMPAPQVTPTPQCGARAGRRPARSTANVSLTTAWCRSSPAACSASAEPLPPRAGRRWPRRPTGAGVRGARAAARRPAPAGRGRGADRPPSTPTVCSAVQPPARRDRARWPAACRRRRPAPRRSCCCRRRWPARPAVRGRGLLRSARSRRAQGRYAAFSASSRSVSWPARSYWPTSGCASRAARHPVPAAAQRRVHGELLVGGHVRDQAAHQRARPAPPAPARRRRRRSIAGHLDHRLVGQERQGARRCGR